MGMLLYSSLLTLALVVGSPWWMWRMLSSRRYREGLPERFGRVPRGLSRAIAGRKVIWLHAVSVGEVLAAERLIAELKQALPRHTLVVSTTTATGQQIAKERLPNTPIFFLPLDFAYVVRRYLRRLRPELLILMESELWPRLLVECKRAGIPVAVANARISDRSLRRYLRLRRLWKPLLENVSLFLAQGEESASRLREIGAPSERVHAIGNLKFDAPLPQPDRLFSAIQQELPAEARLIVCGSTLEGEEATLLDAWSGVLGSEPGAVLLLAPRHPQRFETVARLIAQHTSDGSKVSLRASEFILRPRAIPFGSVFLLDTLGGLASIYQLAHVAFLGGSLVAKGGHNPLEAARFGVPIVMGPSYENFREIVERMRDADAIRIAEPHQLRAAFEELLVDGRALGERGRRCYEAQAGATERTVQALVALLTERSR